MDIGQYNSLVIARLVDFGAYLVDQDGEEVLFPKKYMLPENKIGDMVEVFVYTDSEDRPVATSEKPFGVCGEFVCLDVKDTTGAGAFLDWGLEKDLFVPGSEQHKPLQAGQRAVVRIDLDPRTMRPFGSTKFSAYLQKDVSSLEKGQEVNLMVTEFTDLGIMCLIDLSYRGMLYKNEVFRNLDIGDELTGYIKEVREDGKIDLSLYKNTLENLLLMETVLLQDLKTSGGFIPMGDFSSPQEIKDRYEISKKVFKQLIGRLYKEKKIDIEPQGIRLK
jgi:predicted RNA-binding protein (virulence factor B family)